MHYFLRSFVLTAFRPSGTSDYTNLRVNEVIVKSPDGRSPRLKKIFGVK